MQPVIPAFLSIGRGVGDILPGILPADVVALATHQQDELVPGPGVSHTLVDAIHQLEFPAFSPGGGVVLSGGYCFHLFGSLRLEDRETELGTDRVIALAKFGQLRFADMELPAVLQADAVDDEVGMDVFPVGVGADQDFAALEILRQLQRGGVGGGGIDRFSCRKGLDHVVEHPAAVLVVEELGSEEIIIDALRTAVDAADQLAVTPSGFLFLLDVPHGCAHAAPALTTGIVCETDDGYLPRLPCSWMPRSWRQCLPVPARCAPGPQW